MVPQARLGAPDVAALRKSVGQWLMRLRDQMGLSRLGS